MPRTPFYSQMEATECGAACLAMILAHHGHHASLAEVREVCGVSRDGTNAAALLRGARHYGLIGTGHRVEPEDLGSGPLPAILHWEFNHFVVAVGASKRSLRLLDPAVGPRVVTMARADDAFTGVRLTFEPGPDFVKKAATGSSRKRYLRIFRRGLSGFALTLLSAFVLELVGLLFPIMSQVAIDFVVRPKQTRFLFALAVVLVVAALVRFALATARNRIMGGLRVNLDTWLATEFVEHMIRLPLSFFSQRDAGDLMSRAEAHTAIRDVMKAVATTALDALLVVSYSALMMAYSVRLGAVGLLVTAVRVSFTVLLQAWVRDQTVTEIVASARESSVLVESFGASEAIKAFGIEGTAQRRYVDALTDRLNATISRERIEENVKHVLPFLDGLGLGLIYWVGGRLVSSDAMTIGVLSAFVAMAGLVSAPLQSVVSAAGGLPKIRQLLRRLDDIWDTLPERQGGADPGRLDGAVSLRGVTMRHGGGAVVLHEIDLDVSAGERVAIVGPSGSGKSTLAMVIAGWVTPTSGTVSLDGHALDTLDLADVWAQIGVVTPDAGPFAATIRENIAIGDPEKPLADIERAARDASIDHDIAALPNGYDTRLQSNGTPLSGGQRQRIALARALLKTPRLLLLDEATSSLDVALEQEILDKLRARDCTQVIITHRVSAMRQADRILVMAGGKIVDQGSFEELEARCSVFEEIIAAHGQVTL